MNAKQLTAQISQDQRRIAVLTKEIGMLRQAQRHLSGIPARHNLQRIAQRADELQTLELLADLYTRDDALACETAAA